MNLLLKWTAIFAALMILLNTSGHAWNIGAKGLMTGTTIHATYFLTPNNAPFVIHAFANIGTYNNGTCTYQTTSYDLNREKLQTGDNVYIDGLRLQSLVGLGYSCMTITYMFDQSSQQAFQPVQETFQLVANGINYVTTIPSTAEITIP